LGRIAPFDPYSCLGVFPVEAAHVTINRMTLADYKKIRGPLEHFSTVHETVTTAAGLFEELKTFDEAKWAFRGQGKDWPLTATIDRHAIRPGIAEDYAMREFRRRIHQYVTDVPHRDDDLEWLALMQHLWRSYAIARLDAIIRGRGFLCCPVVELGKSVYQNAGRSRCSFCYLGP